MDEQTLRTLFVNTVLVANADGEVSPEERTFIQNFVTRAGISEAQMRTWLGSIREGESTFQPLESDAHADALFALLVGAASSDGKLSPAEREALLQWGRVMGLTAEQVRDKARALWQHDVLADWFPAPDAPADTSTDVISAGTETGVEALIVSNQFSGLQAMLEVSPEVSVQVTTMNDAPAGLGADTVAVFHAHEDKADTLDMLSWVRRHVGAQTVIVVLNRHQAFQISYLYEHKVDRCLVEPVYPDELKKVVLAARAD